MELLPLLENHLEKHRIRTRTRTRILEVPKQLLTCQDHSHFAGVDQEQRGAVEVYVIAQHTLGIVAHVHVQIPKDDADENVRKDAGQQQELQEIQGGEIHFRNTFYGYTGAT